jgi:hypothetical protein
MDELLFQGRLKTDDKELDNAYAGLGKYALAAVGGGVLAKWASKNRAENLEDAPPEVRAEFDQKA